MEKTTAGKVDDTCVGRYIELYIPAGKPRVDGEVHPVRHGAGKLVNYRKRGNHIDFILTGNFEPVSVRQTDFMQVFTVDENDNLS